MPSAEHAPMPQAGPPGPGTGSVIHLADRLRRRTAAHPAPTPEPAPTTPAFELALTIQAMYQSTGQSLNDPTTAAAYKTALEAVVLLLNGAHATDAISDDSWKNLRAMLDDMAHAPDLV
ncbi:hypothetical protein ACFY8X_38880 [Streptomyces tanashiensis]|uniref:hypothetical protein n=1 Tax=Streptomyces tanashiensis TaxID=67367 RepID=UPI0036E76086